MNIPSFPDFALLSQDFKDEMHPALSLTVDGISEFTFSGLYLFRQRYGYTVSRLDSGFVVSGTQPPDSHGSSMPGRFFMTPCGVPEKEVLRWLFDSHDYWKNIGESVLEPCRENLEKWGIAVNEDRDNFDYLYARSDLADLAGKKYHKKRNLVQQFVDSYECEQRLLSGELAADAVRVLDRWREDKGEDGDYTAAKEALELFDVLGLQGSVFYIDGEPAGYCLGESAAAGKMFTVHFEKGIDRYKGIYQFINKSFAGCLPDSFEYINREQDLGDEGLRQAKMTYRPAAFVKKYCAPKPAAFL